MSNWSEKSVLVTGGCSFIGSHLVGALIEKGARVRVVDNLSSGKLENIQHWIDLGAVDFLAADLLECDHASHRPAGRSRTNRVPGRKHGSAALPGR